MIYYENDWRSLALKWHGSVIPMAALISFPASCIALGMKIAIGQGLMELNSDFVDLMSKTSVFSGFAFVLGFSLVFRAQQSYTRYWCAATAIHQMSTEWTDACGSIMAFAQVTTNHNLEEVHRFMHTMCRLFSLLHAVALQEIAVLDDEDFPLLDIEGFAKEDLSMLFLRAARGLRMEVVLAWIKSYVVQGYSTGLISVPPPILTRVFSELGVGIVNCHKAEQVVLWPFPFPYVQLNILLLTLYMLLTPFMVCPFDVHPALAFCITLVSLVPMVSLELIGGQLDNPFGTDANDLPCFEMQDRINKALLLKLHPSAWQVPVLQPSVITAYSTLARKMDVLGNSHIPRSRASEFDERLTTHPHQFVTEYECGVTSSKTGPSVRSDHATGGGLLQTGQNGEDSYGVDDDGDDHIAHAMVRVATIGAKGAQGDGVLLVDGNGQRGKPNLSPLTSNTSFRPKRVKPKVPYVPALREPGRGSTLESSRGDALANDHDAVGDSGNGKSSRSSPLRQPFPDAFSTLDSEASAPAEVPIDSIQLSSDTGRSTEETTATPTKPPQSPELSAATASTEQRPPSERRRRSGSAATASTEQRPQSERRRRSGRQRLARPASSHTRQEAPVIACGQEAETPRDSIFEF